MDELETYKKRLGNFIHSLVEEVNSDNVPKSFAAFELINTISDAQEKSIPFETIAESIPVRDWRENTVTLPMALVEEIIENWETYNQNESFTLGEAFSLEGGQGKKAYKKLWATIVRDKKLSNEAVIDLLFYRKMGKIISQDAAFAQVAEDNSCSPDVVKKAFQKYSAQTYKRYEELESKPIKD